MSDSVISVSCQTSVLSDRAATQDRPAETACSRCRQLSHVSPDTVDCSEMSIMSPALCPDSSGKTIAGTGRVEIPAKM